MYSPKFYLALFFLNTLTDYNLIAGSLFRWLEAWTGSAAFGLYG